MKRALVTVAVTAIVATVLAGCSPGHWPTLALVLVDGRPAALVDPCPADRLTLLVVSEVRGGDASDWPQWHSQGERPLANGETVPLLDDPAGWSTTRADVTELGPDRAYRAQAWGEQVSLGVGFTLADLNGLAADEVWSTSDGDTGRAMPRQQFERSANADCSRR